MPANKDVASRIYNHPDFQEIVSKLLTDISPIDISEAINARYSEVEEKKFQLSERMIKDFKAHYLDFYTTMRTDLTAIKSSQSVSTNLTESLNNNIAYKDALTRYANQEIDIKKGIQKLYAAAEIRVEQVFDTLQNDPENLKFDRILIEWVVALKDLLKDCNELINGSPDQISVQNNISIQVLDTHMDTVFKIIREILTNLDYETSLIFVDRFHDAMKQLKETRIQAEPIPVAQRLEEVKAFKLPE